MDKIDNIDNLLTEKDNSFFPLGEKHIVLDFYADWCAPCKTSSPTVEKMSEEFPEADFYKINIDESPEIAQKFAIKAIPTFVVIALDGQVSLTLGWEGEDYFRTFIKQSLTFKEANEDT